MSDKPKYQHQSPTIPSNRSGSSKPPKKSAQIATRKALELALKKIAQSPKKRSE